MVFDQSARCRRRRGRVGRLGFLARGRVGCRLCSTSTSNEAKTEARENGAAQHGPDDSAASAVEAGIGPAHRRNGSVDRAEHIHLGGGEMAADSAPPRPFGGSRRGVSGGASEKLVMLFG